MPTFSSVRETAATSAATSNSGALVDGSMEIVAGLNAGDTIVSEGALLLRSAGQD